MCNLYKYILCLQLNNRIFILNTSMWILLNLICRQNTVHMSLCKAFHMVYITAHSGWSYFSKFPTEAHSGELGATVGDGWSVCISHIKYSAIFFSVKIVGQIFWPKIDSISSAWATALQIRKSRIIVVFLIKYLFKVKRLRKRQGGTLWFSEEFFSLKINTWNCWFVYVPIIAITVDKDYFIFSSEQH